MPKLPGFIGGSGQSQSVIATSERTMNFYVENVGTKGTQNKTALYPTPGQQSWASVATSDPGMRGALALSGTSQAFAVMNGTFYELFSSRTVSAHGSVAVNSNLAQIEFNGTTGNQVLVASGNNAYNYDLTAKTLTQVLTNEATQIGMLDEYFLALNANTGRLRLSNLNDGSTWDPLQFALRSAQPDPWQAFVVNPPDIILLGAQTGDVWYDAGTSPFPLAARTGLNIPYGIAANFSLKLTAGNLFWLAQNRDGAGVVVRMQGYSPQKISTPEVDTAISSYQRSSTITDAEGMVYQQEGHTFYVLRFPSANATWVYDLTTGIWHERGTWNSAQNRYDAWHPRVHVYAFGTHIVGESNSAQLSSLDVTFPNEADGTPIRRLRRGPVLINENKTVSIHRFELSMETGVGLVTGQGSNPIVSLRSSQDGGHTFGNERFAGIGQIGQYRRRAYWLMLGSPRLWVPEVVVSDPAPTRIVDAFINNDQDEDAAA